MIKPFPLLTLFLAGAVVALTGCNSKKASSQAGIDAADPDAAAEPTGFNLQFQELLEPVNDQCPQDYPDLVTPIPEADKLQETKTETLMGMLSNWNPVLRMEAAKELGERGTSAISELRQGTHSDNNKVRAGSATALAAICKELSADELPDGMVGDFIRLTTDEEHEVRVAALRALGTLAPKTSEATLAVLALCTDPDEYLAQEAMITLKKYFQTHTLPIGDTEAGLKAAMTGPLPNGKGQIVYIISQLKPVEQRRFIPTLLTHLDWYTRRDTMFAGGGQELALELLTKMNEPQVIPRLPKLMGKTGRGLHLYSPALKAARAYGADAKVILPKFKAILADLEKNGKEAEITPRGELKEGIEELKQTIAALERL